MDQETDIETLEQEARQMRARMDRLERERDELLEALVECHEAMADMSDYDIPIGLPDRVKAAIARVKGGAA